MKLSLLCFAFYIPHALCIFGGENSTLQLRTNFIVSIRHSRHLCGGALITLKFVLTAASCVKDLQTNEFYGQTAVVDFKKFEESVKMNFDKVFIKDQPSGQKQVRNNIALLRVKHNMRASDVDRLREIPISSDNEIAKVGKACRTYGWGRTKLSGDEPTNYLQEMETFIQDLSICKFYNSDVDESNICTRASTSSLCYFDAGDPLTSASLNVLWGIATEDYACSDNPITGDVFTRIESHKDWILKIIEENSSIRRHEAQAITTGTGIIVVLTTWLYL